MVKYRWFKEEVPASLEVRQVYGIVFNERGEVLLREDDNRYKLTGGKPEGEDSSFEETLRREYLEELNMSLEKVYYLGYLLIEENDEVYAQVRMIGKIGNIGNIGEARADLDNGKVYGRVEVPTRHVNNYLKYEDEAGMQMLWDAISLAALKYGFDLEN